MNEAVLDKLWEQKDPLLFVSREEFYKSAKEWNIEPFYIDGELAFVTITNGPRFHFHSFGTKRRLTMKMMRSFLQKIIDQHGYALTNTPREYERQHRFNRLFGFEQVGEDEFDIHYRIEKLRHA